MKIRYFFLLLVLGCIVPAHAQHWLSGTISDSSGLPVAYATVTLNDARYGTLSDDQGQFRLAIPSGAWTLRVTHLGYKPHLQEIRLENDLSLNIKLLSEILSLSEVVIVPGGEDPAYPIIRQAIRLKDQNKQAADQFAFDAYTKTVFQLAEGFSFEKMLANFPGAGKEIVNDSSFSMLSDPLFQTNIFYLSETVSRVWKQKPDKMKEKILRSRVSGSQSESSVFGGFFTNFSPYDNLLFKGEIAERGIVSPLSEQAFFFYEFKLLGTQVIEGVTVYKIQVKYKRKSDAVFQGVIHIADETYAVQAADLWVTKEQAVQLVDSLRMTQEYFLQQGKWVPISTRMHMAINLQLFVLNIPMTGTFSSILSNYDFQPEIPRNFFAKEMIAVTDTAIRRDSIWWEQMRPIPLREREALNYHLKDSIEIAQSSPAYLDSLTRAQRFPGVSEIMSGFTRKNYRTGASFRWDGLANSGFNAIEGWFVEGGASYQRPFGNRYSWEVGTDLRHAFAPNRFHAIGYLGLGHTGFRPWDLQFSAGDYPNEFSYFPQISSFANTVASLWRKLSHIRMYQQRFVALEGNWEAIPGLTVSARGLYERRYALSNRSDYSIRFREDRTYEDNFTLPTHDALIATATVEYQPFMKYIRQPNTKMTLGSRWPVFGATITHGFPIQADAPDFTKLAVSVYGDQSIGLLGTISYRATAGRFLRNQRTYLPDAFHFQGGESFFRLSNRFDAFFLMPYYSYSEPRPFLELHAQNAFGLSFVNKIPGIRKLKISEYFGAHALLMEGKQTYLELNYGLETRIFKILKLRMDVHFFIMGSDRWLPYGFTYWPDGLSNLGIGR